MEITGYGWCPWPSTECLTEARGLGTTALEDTRTKETGCSWLWNVLPDETLSCGKRPCPAFNRKHFSRVFVPMYWQVVVWELMTIGRWTQKMCITPKLAARYMKKYWRNRRKLLPPPGSPEWQNPNPRQANSFRSHKRQINFWVNFFKSKSKSHNSRPNVFASRFYDYWVWNNVDSDVITFTLSKEVNAFQDRAQHKRTFVERFSVNVGKRKKTKSKKFLLNFAFHNFDCGKVFFSPKRKFEKIVNNYLS